MLGTRPIFGLLQENLHPLQSPFSYLHITGLNHTLENQCCDDD